MASSSWEIDESMIFMEIGKLVIVKNTKFR